MKIPTGIIILWSGAIVNIPTGWVLCNGANGTPDLRNRFVIAAGDTYGPDDTGGSVTHTHPFTGDGHTHTHAVGVVIGSGIGHSNLMSTSYATGTTDADGELPPYYALAFIMKT